MSNQKIMLLKWKLWGDDTKTDFSVADWSDTDIAIPYLKSKTLAEKAAWDFIKNLPEDEKFELVTILPGFVLGPNLNEAQFSSGDVIKKLMLYTRTSMT